MLNFAIIRTSIREMEPNPFEDGTDFESFTWLQYKDSRALDHHLDSVELDTPLKIYKYLLLNLPTIDKFENKSACKSIVEKYLGVKAKYTDFLRKDIPMTAQETKYVKSAFATLQLAEILLTLKSGHFKVEEFDFLKLKHICGDIIDCYNANGERSALYLLTFCVDLYEKRYLQTQHFLMCVMTKILQNTREVRTRIGLVPNNSEMDKFMTNTELQIEKVKMISLYRLFEQSSILHTFGPDQSCLELPKDDEEKAKILMELFKNYDGADEYYKIPMKIENFEQAEVVHGLILRLANKQEPRSEESAFEAKHYKGLALGQLAAFETDPAEAYRKAEKSLGLLEKIRDLCDEKKEYDSKDVIEMIEMNLIRMWKIKLEIYNNSKTQENLKALQEIASKRIMWAKLLGAFLKKENNEPAIKRWRIGLDLVECILLVYGDYSCFKKFAEMIYEDLKSSPIDIPNFEVAAGISFERSMNLEKFLEVLAKKIKPNVDTVKNPFEDGTNFDSFVASYYDDPTEKVLAKTNFNTPLNIYKFMLAKLYGQLKKGIGKDEDVKEMLEKVEDIKKKYKAFMREGVSMTDEERKNVRSAYEAVKLTELICSLEFDNKHFKVQDFDFHKLKEICEYLLESSVGEIIIVHLLPMYEIMMKKSYFEVARFIASVMTKTLRKISAETEKLTHYCPCVSDKILCSGIQVNMVNTTFLDRIFRISSILYSIGPMPRYQTIGADKANGKMLMQLLADDADKLPLKAENYEQAKAIYEKILKLLKKRKEVCNITLHDIGSDIFKGLAQSSFAEFGTNPVEIYRLSEESTKLLKICIEADEDAEIAEHEGNIMAAVDQNYRKMWKIKMDNYKRDKSKENYDALKEIATDRIEWGNALCNIVYDLPFEDWWIYLDMMKCHLQVFQNTTAAKECAESIWNYLIRQPDEIKSFVRCAGISFGHDMNKKKFVKALMQKYK